MLKNKGFSIIELLVVIAIIGILAGVAVPSFIEQVKQNKINTVENNIRLAIGRARGIALRNEFGLFGETQNDVVSVVCFAEDEDTEELILSLHEASSEDSAAVCSTDPIWSESVNDDIAIYYVKKDVGGATQELDFVQIAFGNQGQIITDCGVVDCASSNKFNIKLGGTAASGHKVIN